MRLGALFGAAALLATACVSAAPATPLAGQWRVIALNGEAIEGLQAKASFEPHRMTISFGCNSGRGAYRVEGDKLIAPGLARTEMACMPVTDDGPDIMAREDRGFAVVSHPMRIRWQGDQALTLANEAGSIELRRP